MEERKTDDDALQTRKMQRFEIGVAIFLLPFTVAVCIIAFLLSGSLYAFSGLSSFLISAVIFWHAASKL